MTQLQQGLNWKQVSRLVQEKLAAWDAVGRPSDEDDELLITVKMQYLGDAEARRSTDFAQYMRQLPGDENLLRRLDFTEWYVCAVAGEESESDGGDLHDDDDGFKGDPYEGSDNH